MAFVIEGTILKEYIEEAGVTEVTVPEGVTVIDRRAFRYAEHLEVVHLPESLEIIGEEAFAECEKLHTVQMPTHLQDLHARAFFATALTSIVIPEDVVNVPQRCFSNCQSLQKVTLPEGLETLGFGAFQDCPITEIQLPSTLIGIEKMALNALQMEQITLPAGLEVFEPGCLSVKVQISAKNQQYTSYEGALYDKAFQKLLHLPACMLDAKLPRRVTELGAQIVGCVNECTLTLPDQFTIISREAFSGIFCTSVQTLRLRHPRCTVSIPIAAATAPHSRYHEPLFRFLESRNRILREKLLQESLRPPCFRLPLALYLMLSADSLVGRAFFESNPIDTLESLLTEPPEACLLPLLRRQLLPLAAVDDLIELANQKHCQETQLLLMRYKQENGGYGAPTENLKL